MRCIDRMQDALHRKAFGAAMPRVLGSLIGMAGALSIVPAVADDGVRLGEVVVTATQREQDIRDVPAAASVVTRGEIERAGAENVLEAIRDTPGLGLIGQSVAGRKTVSLRGMDGKHTLFLVDGLRVIATDDWVGHSDYQYDWTPIDGVERVEVVRGPMSVLYGSDALGGVVNVITARPPAEWSGRVRLNARQADGAGGGDSTSVGFQVAGGLGDALRLSLSGTRLDRKPLKLKEDKRTSEIEGKELETLHLRLSWQLAPSHTLDFEHRIADEKRWRDSLSRATVPVLHRDTYRIDRSQSVLTWRGEVGRAQTVLRAWESEFAVENARTNGVAPTRPQSMDERGLDGRVAFSVGSRQNLTVGFDLRDETMKNAGLAGGRDTARHRALYVQDEIVLADDLMLTLGVRHDRHNYFGGETSPRAYLVWHATDRWTVRGGYGEGFRAPTLKQISPSYEGHEGPHSFYGNEDLKPETSRSVEFGVAYGDPRFDWEATVFRNEVKDLVTTRLFHTDPTPPFPARSHYVYDNVNQARIQGLETALTWYLQRGFHVGFNGQWLDTEDKSTGRSLNARPTQQLNARVGWRQDKWDAALRLQHVGKQWFAVTGGRERAPAYELLHASVSHDLNPHMKLGFGVDNLTNVRLRDKSERFNYSEMPRTWRVSLNGSF